MDRRFSTVVVVVLMLSAGCLGGDRPLVPDAAAGMPAPETPEATPASSPSGTTGSAGTPTTGTSTPARQLDDPPTDRRGWEDGYWYNETLPITTADGLNGTELEVLVARTTARVERIRHVEFEEPVAVETITRETFRDRYGGGGGEGRYRTYQDALAEALLLVGEDRDAFEVRQRNRGSGVLGFYSPGEDRITIVTEGETARLRGTVLAHELVHAYQFRQTDAGELRAETTDGRRAIQSVIEGDASLVERRYEQRCAAGWSCVSAERGGNLSNAHLGLYYLALFPYTDGETFVEQIQADRGWEGVDRLYEDPPQTTEEVIYPERYPDETAVTVRLPDRSGRDWERLYRGTDTLGQPAVAAMFAYTAVDDREGAVIDINPFRADRGGYSYNFSYADGWAGDAFRVYRNGETIAYTWRIAWDSPAEAREFAAGYREVLRYWGAERVPDRSGVWRIPEGASPFADAFYLSVEGDTVTVVNAPSVRALPAVFEGVPTG